MEPTGLCWTPVYSNVFYCTPFLSWVLLDSIQCIRSMESIILDWIVFKRRKSQREQSKKEKERKKEWRLIITRHKLYNEDERLK